MFYCALATRTLWFCITGGLHAQNAGLKAIFRANLLKIRVLSPWPAHAPRHWGERGGPLSPQTPPSPWPGRDPRRGREAPWAAAAQSCKGHVSGKSSSWRSPQSGIPNALRQSCRRRLHVRVGPFFLALSPEGQALPKPFTMFVGVAPFFVPAWRLHGRADLAPRALA